MIIIILTSKKFEGSPLGTRTKIYTEIIQNYLKIAEEKQLRSLSYRFFGRKSNKESSLLIPCYTEHEA